MDVRARGSRAGTSKRRGGPADADAECSSRIIIPNLIIRLFSTARSAAQSFLPELAHQRLGQHTLLCELDVSAGAVVEVKKCNKDTYIYNKDDVIKHISSS